MLAVDTNVIVRYLTADDAAQFAKARSLIENEDLYVCTTVLLETEWVLRRVYGYRPAGLLEALLAVAGLPRVTLEDPTLAAQALEWMSGGMDFADALHLAKAAGCEAFVSFDRPLARLAARIAGVKVRAP